LRYNPQQTVFVIDNYFCVLKMVEVNVEVIAMGVLRGLIFITLRHCVPLLFADGLYAVKVEKLQSK